MSFPYPSSIASVNQLKAYWRLYTGIETSGDIYESETSALAFAIGGDSDIARAKISYFDQQEADRVNEQIVSIDRPFIGQIDANMLAKYATGQRARILISILDVIPSATFTPPTAGGTDRVMFAQPVLELVQYTNQQPNYLPTRSDKQFRYETIGTSNPVLLGRAFWFIIPFYGRRFGQVTVKNLDSSANLAVTTFGFNFSLTGLDSNNQSIQIDTDATVAPAATVTQIVNNQTFDAIGVQITPDGALDSTTSVFTNIVVSDKI